MYNKYLHFDNHINYHAPMTLDKLFEFSKRKDKLDDELPLFLSLMTDDKYAITNYGRIIKLGKNEFIQITKKDNKSKLNDIYNLVFKTTYNGETKDNILVDSIRKAFFSEDIYRTHTNIRFRDGNKFNFRLDNIVFLEDIFYEGVLYEDTKMEPIMYNNEPTNYEINTEGKIIQKHTKKIQGRTKNLTATDPISLKINNKYVDFRRYEWMGKTFIQNIHNFKHCVLISSNRLTPSLTNIKWTDRISLPIDL